MRLWPWLVGGGVVVAAGGIAYAERSHPAPCDPMHVQARPLPTGAWTVAQTATIRDILTYQLACLGYGMDAASIQRFASDHGSAVAAYLPADASMATTTFSDAGRASAMVADDLFRAKAGAARANDYVAPSSGLALNRYRQDRR